MNNSAHSLLQPSSPVTLVNSSICKIHLSISRPFILHIIAFINISRLPHKLPIPVLLIIIVMSIIPVASHILNILPPLSITLLHSLVKLSLILTLYQPSVSPSTLWNSILVISSVLVTVLEDISAFAMLFTLYPLTFIHVTYICILHLL